MADIIGLPVGQRTVAALGIFDGVHIGHRCVLRAAADEARRQAQHSSVPPHVCVFTFDGESIATKGKALMPDEEKRLRLMSCGADTVYSADFSLMKGLSPEEFVRDVLISKLGCAAAVCGRDFRFGRSASGGCDDLTRLCGEQGCRVVAVPSCEEDGVKVSSSLIKELIQSGDIARANRLLGQPYGYSLTVSHGNALGRTLGFPTINQLLPSVLLPPRFGVYCSRTETGGKSYEGVTNVGVKPTVGGNTPSLETHIFGFSGDLYGKSVRIELLEFLRDERRFDSTDQLRRQVLCDRQTAAEYFRQKKLSHLFTEKGQIL